MAAYVRREYPEWSWSFSRQQTFLSCARKYYYNYYGSHNGWERDADAEAALAYRLKKLTNIYLVLGDAVHKVAANLVAEVVSGRVLPSSDFVEEEIRRQLRRVWFSSRDNLNYFIQRPNRVEMLHEFYYGEGLEDTVVEKINERANTVANALVNSNIFTELRQKDVELISCEQFDTFLIDTTKVYAVPDLLFKTASGMYEIVDWKTGEEAEDNRAQMALYALYVQNKHEVPAEKIRARLEYLNLGTSEEQTFTNQELQEVEEFAKKSISELSTLLLDKDLNKPKEKGDFPLTDKRKFCFWCNFYELCREELSL